MTVYRNDKGSFTLEATLVFPIILFSMLIFIFFCMYIYQGAVLGQLAITAAERSAYSWDNSHRQARTGALAEEKFDSLYWRLSSDSFLHNIFGRSSMTSPSAVLQLPAESANLDSLALTKLYKVGQELPSALNGTMDYDNELLSRTVTVTLERVIPLMPLEKVIGDTNQYGKARAYIVDPVEFIRTVELIRYYGSKFKGTDNGSMDPNEAENALGKFAK